MTGGTPVQIATDGGWVSQESPDGKGLYFASTPAIGKPSPIWLMPTSGGTPVRVLDAVAIFSFAVVYRGIYYIDQSSNRTRLQFYNFATRRLVTMAGDLGEGSQLVGGFAASRDDRVVSYSRRDAAIDDLMLVNGFR